MGMPKIELRLQMFRGDWDQIWSQQRLLWMMEGLCRVNQTHLRQFNEFLKRGLVEKTYPALYRSGLHYETEKGTEIWPDIPSMYSGIMGKGVYPGVWFDCEDGACARVAEYRELPWHYERPFPGRAGKIEQADPQFPQGEKELAAAKRKASWPGWKKVKGGIKAKPFAKWRRGPQGNYHYHALVLMPDGRLEDPSLVLGMGREKVFSAEGTAEKYKSGALPVKIMYAEKPDVMVVDPEKPSGYAGGKAKKFDDRVSELVKKGVPAEKISQALGDVELGAYLTNQISECDGEMDIDSVIGWNRAEKRFSPKSDSQETRRLLGYRNHENDGE